jgi:hypothetical protein
MSNRGSHVVGATACGMRRSAPAATAEKLWPSGNFAASLAITVNFERLSFRRSQAACGGGPTRVIVRHWTISIGHYSHHVGPRRIDKDEQSGLVRRAAPRLNYRTTTANHCQPYCVVPAVPTPVRQPGNNTPRGALWHSDPKSPL